MMFIFHFVKPLFWVFLIFLGFGSAPVLAQQSVRYALIVGNNHGQAPHGFELPDLQYAEREVYQLREKLILRANFGSSPRRVKVLAGKGRKEILAAARQIAQQHKKDRLLLGDVSTFFVLFFTGHGLQGELLTADQPLTGRDLASIFKQVNATFSVGVFDACFSGSLDLDSMRAKGLTYFPGHSIFEAMPRELLNSKGTMWMVSSQSDQISYEDDRIGGVFTHFFIQALDQARSDGIGITLNDIWEYARSHTHHYTRKTGRPQTPRQVVRDMTSTGPVYFSFTSERQATLAFDAGVSGDFVIRYQQGHFSEVITKAAKSVTQVPIYTGPIVLERITPSGRQIQKFVASKGTKIWIRNQDTWQNLHMIGQAEKSLKAKGTGLSGLVLTKQSSTWSASLDLGYQATWSSLSISPTAQHGSSLGLRMDRGIFYARLGLAYGEGSRNFPEWGFRLSRWDLSLEVGPAINVGPIRLSVGGVANLFAWDAHFKDGAKYSRGGFGLGGCGSMLLSLGQFYLDAHVGLRQEKSPLVAPQNSQQFWRRVPWASVSLGWTFF